MKVLLLGNGTKQGVLETVEALRPEIERRVTIVASNFDGLEDMSHVEADLAIVFGGDGSILRAASQMGINQIPVLAVHLGTLSFLSTIRVNDLIPLLDRPDLLALPIVDHLLLECRHCVAQEEGVARIVLNEVLVQGETSSRIIGLDLHIDGELVTTYRGDGLILSTPVGSTAHNLSAGGPILRKDIDAVVISPVNPHTLSNRPLVDSPDRCYEIRPHQAGVLVLDGAEVIRLKPGDTVRIGRAPQTFKTLAVPGYSYYRTLRDKLGWNAGFTEDMPAK